MSIVRSSDAGGIVSRRPHHGLFNTVFDVLAAARASFDEMGVNWEASRSRVFTGGGPAGGGGTFIGGWRGGVRPPPNNRAMKSNMPIVKIYFGNQKEWEGRPVFLTSN